MPDSSPITSYVTKCLNGQSERLIWAEVKMSARDAMWSPYRKPLGAVNTYDSWLASQEKRTHRLVVWNPLQYQIKNTKRNLTAERVEATAMQHEPRRSHLVFELFNLAFEVTDVLGWVCVIQLTLDLSFFLLLAEWNSINQRRPWQQAKAQQYRLRIFTATCEVKAGCCPRKVVGQRYQGKHCHLCLISSRGPRDETGCWL